MHKIIFLSILSLASCGDEQRKLYVLDTMRIPVAQFYTKQVDITPGAAQCSQDWCPQYPARANQELFLKLVVIYPGTTQPLLTITKIDEFSGLFLAPTPASRALSAGNTGNEKPANITLTERPEFHKILTTEPLTIQEFMYSVTIPTSESIKQFAIEKKAFPAFDVHYTVTLGAMAERGFITLLAAPTPEEILADEPLYKAIIQEQYTLLGTPQLAETAWLKLLQTTKTNTPPKIDSLQPINPTKGSKTELSATLAEQDSDPNAKQRIFWFVSQGEIQNPRRLTTLWTPKESTLSLQFLTVRDLQGGSDFAFQTVKVP